MIENILAPFLNAAVDRFRGSGSTTIKCDWNAAFLFALIIFMLYPNLSGWEIFLLGILYKLGESSGWGEPLGALFDNREMTEERLEWWQKGILARNIDVAVLFRGFMWSVPISLFFAYYISPILAIVTVVSTVISFYVSPLIVTRLIKFDAGTDTWGKMEEVRGFLMMMPISLWFYV